MWFLDIDATLKLTVVIYGIHIHYMYILNNLIINILNSPFVIQAKSCCSKIFGICYIRLLPKADFFKVYVIMAIFTDFEK